MADDHPMITRSKILVSDDKFPEVDEGARGTESESKLESKINEEDFKQNEGENDPSLSYKFGVIGRSMGLTGSDLVNFVKDMVKAEYDKEKSDALLDMEARERVAKLEFEKRKHEANCELERQRLELERQKLVLEQDRLNSPHVNGVTTRHDSKHYPKLPPFKENEDEIDSYLFRFETHAKNCKWPEKEWSSYVMTYLHGEALGIFYNLSRDGPCDYKVLKTRLLYRFRCTKDGFRERFREIKPNENEDMNNFSSRIALVFDRWLELANVGKNFDKLSDLILCEQFMSSVSKDLNTFLKEKRCENLEDMVKEAEGYRLAHPNKDLSRRQSSNPLDGNFAFQPQGQNYNPNRNFGGQN